MKNSYRHYRKLNKATTALSDSLKSAHSKLPHRLRHLPSGWKGWLKLFGKLFVGGLVVLALLFIWFSKDLPTPGKLKNRQLAQSTQIFDRTGQPLFTVAQDEKRIVLTSEGIPDYVKKATVSIEDHNFYQHMGVDFKGIARALLANITHGSAREGGSTITQQYVKNALLDPRKTISRKIKEVILALEVEVIYTKDQILTNYLNEIPYGSTAYGVEAASQMYFGKHAKELTLAQSATLAALPQAPTHFSPYGNHKDELLKRKDRVLQKMVDNGYIKASDMDAAKQEQLTFIPARDSIVAPHFVFWIKEQLVDKYGEEMVNKGGLKVTTTLDLDTQKKAIDAVDSGSKKLDKYDANNAALVAVDPKTGQVLAMVGSRDYFNNDIHGQVNVTIQNRQPGSSFKPYVYATAFADPKYNPAYVLYDLKTDFGGGYSPDNYNGRSNGPVTMRQALANSLNIPAVKTLDLVGIDKVLQTADNVGIKFGNDPKRCGLALVLGCAEVSPLEMASGFSTFINNGVHADVTGILKVETPSGEVLDEFKEPKETKALDPQQSFLIADVMSDNDARALVFGTRNFLTVPGHKVGAKTGTTQDFHDAWTVGYSPLISTAVWVGNTNNDKMNKGADGSVVAAPIWQKFMSDYLKDKPDSWIDKPEGISRVTVDKFSNRIPTNDSPSDQNITDFFASWHNSIRDTDNVHTRVKVNKLNGKLATDQTPLDLIEEKVFSAIHSEKPTNSNWEGPVLAWASQNGLDRFPPTDKDDLYSLDKQPVVVFKQPTDNASLSGQIDVVLEAQAAYSVKKISLALDGVSISEANDTNKVTFSIKSDQITAGNHKLTAFVFDSNGASSNSSIKITYTSTPLQISNLLVVPTSTTASFTWLTNYPTTDIINFGTTPTLTQSSVLNSTKTISHSVTLGALSPNTTYYYQAKSTTDSGQSVLSDLSSFTTKP